MSSTMSIPTVNSRPALRNMRSQFSLELLEFGAIWFDRKQTGWMYRLLGAASQ